jgi:hypothetical protein
MKIWTSVCESDAPPGSRSSCGEVSRAEPDGIGSGDIICDIAFPLGDD